MAKIVIDDVELQLAPVQAGAAYGIHLCQTHNWHDPSDAKVSVVEQQTFHGAFPNQPAWRESVLVSFEGTSIGVDRADYQRLRNELAQLGAGKASIRIALEDGEERTWRDGYVVAVNIKDDHNKNWFTWSIDVRCPDPRRYGSVQVDVENMRAGGAQYNLATGNGWRVSNGAGDDKASAGVDDGFTLSAATSSAGKVKHALFYRIPKLAFPVRRVRLKVRGWQAGVKPRLNLSWLSDGMLRRVDAYTPQAISENGGEIIFDQHVTQPDGVSGLTVAIESYDPVLPLVSAWAATELMVGAFTDESFQDGDSLGWAWLDTDTGRVAAQLGTRWTLDNQEGTAPSTPAITVTAARDMPKGFTLSFYGSDDELVYPGAIQAGQTVELLPGEHAVLIDGRLSPVVAIGKWPQARPGAIEQLSLTSNTASDFTATCTWSPAWW